MCWLARVIPHSKHWKCIVVCCSVIVAVCCSVLQCHSIMKTYCCVIQHSKHWKYIRISSWLNEKSGYHELYYEFYHHDLSSTNSNHLDVMTNRRALGARTMLCVCATCCVYVRRVVCICDMLCVYVCERCCFCAFCVFHKVCVFGSQKGNSTSHPRIPIDDALCHDLEGSSHRTHDHESSCLR